MVQKRCVKCGSERLDLKDLKEGIYECYECGYLGPLMFDDEVEE